MARAASADDVLEVQRQVASDHSQSGAAPGSLPLLEAVAVQRPIQQIAELATILEASDHHAHAQGLLSTAASARPLEEVVQLLPLLSGDQAAHALCGAATRRPVEELANLVQLLNETDQPAHAHVVLVTAATERPVQDVAAMIAVLGSHVHAEVVHSAAAGRPIEEVAQLADQLDQAVAPAPSVRQD